MALIWRGIFEVTDPDLSSSAEEILCAWLRWKLKEPLLQLKVDGTIMRHGSHEIVARRAAQPDRSVFRGALYERRPEEELRTTLTVLCDKDISWVWVDLERWSDDPFIEPWTPIAPGLVSSLLRERACARGATQLSDCPQYYKGREGEALAAVLLDAHRGVPVVVVSPGQRERSSPSVLERRAIQLQRRLAGIAPVAVVHDGAVESFSRVMTAERGEGFDVYGGAIRTYLPGEIQDYNRHEHRIVPFHRVRGRSPSVVADLVAAPIQRGACAQPPPALWREQLRALLEPTQLTDDEIQEELLRLEREREQERSARSLLEQTIEHERDANARTERENDQLRRRLAWLERQLREAGAPPKEQPASDDLDPDFCGEVPSATERLPYVVFPREQWPHADDLDTHVSSAWAKRAWRALRALNAYATEKADGSFAGNLWDFCADGRSDAVPTGWIALRESETTDNNERFRALREFPIDPRVCGRPTIYMPAHIKIVSGGYPAPRIHFHDDTGGATGKVHVGYFGEHRDNSSKS